MNSTRKADWIAFQKRRLIDGFLSLFGGIILFIVVQVFAGISFQKPSGPVNPLKSAIEGVREGPGRIIWIVSSIIAFGMVLVGSHRFLSGLYRACRGFPTAGKTPEATISGYIKSCFLDYDGILKDKDSFSADALRYLSETATGSIDTQFYHFHRYWTVRNNAIIQEAKDQNKNLKIIKTRWKINEISRLGDPNLYEVRLTMRCWADWKVQGTRGRPDSHHRVLRNSGGWWQVCNSKS